MQEVTELHSGDVHMSYDLLIWLFELSRDGVMAGDSA